MAKGLKPAIAIPESHNALIYLLEGSLKSDDTTLDALNLGVYKNDGESIHLRSKKSGKALLLAGEPINEPVASQGPFVMNYPGEIKQAMLDYSMGKMGVLEG